MQKIIINRFQCKENGHMFIGYELLKTNEPYFNLM